MRITLVSETFWPQTNGVSNVLGRLVDYARAQGHPVQLVIPRYRERQPDPEEVWVPSMPFPLYPEVRICFPRPGKIWKRIVAFQPDLIHIATEASLGLAVLWKARKGPFPIVTSYHTNFTQYARHYYLGFLENAAWKYLRWFHNQSPPTYCPSRMTLAELQDRGLQGVEIWSRGLETGLFNPGHRSLELRRNLGVRDEDVLLVYVGRLAKEKNLPVLLQAFDRLKAKVPEVKLLLVGDGPIRASLEKRTTPDILCVGYKRGKELAAHYASGDLFAFPSLTETFGNVVLEAMGCGLPVVGFEAGGVPHSVRHGESGLLAPPDHPEVFTSHLETLCRDAALRKRMSEAARTYAESQTWEQIFSRLFDSYRRVIESKKGPR